MIVWHPFKSCALLVPFVVGPLSFCTDFLTPGLAFLSCPDGLFMNGFCFVCCICLLSWSNNVHHMFQSCVLCLPLPLVVCLEEHASGFAKRSVMLFLTCKMWFCVMISVISFGQLAGWPSWCYKNFVIFSDTVNVVSVKLYMMVLIELYLLIPLNFYWPWPHSRSQ